VILCKSCWRDEYEWRLKVNQKLDDGDSTLKRWPIYGFYNTSPYSDQVEFDEVGNGPHDIAAAKRALKAVQEAFPPETVDFDDLGLTANLVPHDPDDESKGYAYAIMDADGNTIDWADDIHKLQDYMDNTRELLRVVRNEPPNVDMGDLIGNPRVVLLWDRINGNTVIGEYVAYIVRRDLIRRHSGDQVTLFEQMANPIELVTTAVEHATNTANEDFEWVVVVLPVGWEHNKRQRSARTTVEKSYATFLAMQILDTNIRELVEKGREPS
jgi:hypothetical protein